MRVISDICGATDANIRDIDNWLNRVDLTTEYLEFGRGRGARRFTFENTLELALLAAFTGAGLKPSEANMFANTVLRIDKYDDRCYVFFQGSRPGLVTYEAEFKKWLNDNIDSLASFSVVRPCKIYENVKSFFDKNSFELDGAEDRVA